MTTSIPETKNQRLNRIVREALADTENYHRVYSDDNYNRIYFEGHCPRHSPQSFKNSFINRRSPRWFLKHGFHSFWGHGNTIAAANKMLGINVTPKTERPAVILTDEGLPSLYGDSVRKVIGEEVPEDKITGWQCLLREWV